MYAQAYLLFFNAMKKHLLTNALTLLSFTSPLINLIKLLKWLANQSHVRSKLTHSSIIARCHQLVLNKQIQCPPEYASLLFYLWWNNSVQFLDCYKNYCQILLFTSTHQSRRPQIKVHRMKDVYQVWMPTDINQFECSNSIIAWVREQTSEILVHYCQNLENIFTNQSGVNFSRF